jgi:hypothetical protein
MRRHRPAGIMAIADAAMAAGHSMEQAPPKTEPTVIGM